MAEDDYVVIIATWRDEAGRTIDIQDFVQGGETFIPVFSDEAHFAAETSGSGFEDKGVRIRKDLFRDLLRGNELLILDPGSAATRLRKADL